MGLRAGGRRRRAAGPRGAAGLLGRRTWHYPWRWGEGGSAFFSPGGSSQHAAGRQVGSLRELVRFLGEILADESGRAVASVRPACRWQHTVNQICVPPRAAVIRFGEKGHTRHRACAEAGCGLPNYSSQRALPEPRAL